MKVVVAHSGARDGYQVSLALSEAGLLDRLVTDLYWPADRKWASSIERMIPARAAQLLSRRCIPGLPSRRVNSVGMAGVCAAAATKAKFMPFRWRRDTERWADSVLGAQAGRTASSRQAAMLSYSYYAHSAFSQLPGATPKILFQVHPHPSSVREILKAELRKHPDCEESLLREWEMGLAEPDFDRLVAETSMANDWITASTFTRETLVRHGAPANRIHVVPYGVDSQRFQPDAHASTVKSVDRPLRLLFVGTINQRKGIKYLLGALKLLKTKNVHVQVCGRPVDDLKLFEPFQDSVTVRPNVTSAELLQAYRSSDLFVFPSMAEGFGHVLLEAMACGLPVLSTERTAFPDIAQDGIQGLLADTGSAESLASKIDWSLSNRRQLLEMGHAARLRAEFFSWQRFRHNLVSVVTEILNPHRPNVELVQDCHHYA